MSELQDQARRALRRGRRARRSPTPAEADQRDLVRDADGRPVTVPAAPALITITDSGALAIQEFAGEEESR